MNKFLGLFSWALLATTLASAQEPPQLFTRPTVPTRETLDRLNLKLGWRTQVPMEGRQDGFFSVQLLGNQILVQTRGGTVALLNALDGSLIWRTRFDVPYRVSQGLAFNGKNVYAVRGPRLYSLMRENGQLEFDAPLSAGPSATPVADDDQIYLCLNDQRLMVYDLPKLFPDSPSISEKKLETVSGASKEVDNKTYAVVTKNRVLMSAVGPLSSARQAAAQTFFGPQPIRVWDYLSDSHLEQTPLLFENMLLLAGTDGSYFGLSKLNRVVLYQHKTKSNLMARLGQHEEMAYVAGQDYSIYAINMLAGKIIWRVTGGSPLLHKPAVTEEDVYVASKQDGLQRIARATGDLAWTKPNLVRIQAMNKKFVYAVDRNHKTVILDRERGSHLGTLDTREFPFPIVNELTDRIFLAAHDGTLVCLHDRDYATPQVMKKFPEFKSSKKPSAKAKEKGEAKPKDKGEDKPKEEKPKEKEKEPEMEKEKEKGKEKGKEKEPEKKEDKEK